MIGQHVDALDIGERGDEIAQLLQVLILVGDARYQDMANPYRLVNVAQGAGAVEYVFIGMPSKFTVLFFIDVLDVKKNGIGDGHQMLKFLEENALSGKRLRRGIKTSVDATPVRFLKELDEKVYLHEGFSPTHGDAALVAPIGAESLCLVEQFVGGIFLSLSHCPGIGIVTKLAAHRAALQKYQKSDAWSIYRTKAL